MIFLWTNILVQASSTYLPIIRREMADVCWKQLLRRKKLATLQKAGVANPLGRSLELSDLIFLGVGSTLGVGIYILPGSVAKADAGPAIVLSFFIAAVISILAGEWVVLKLCITYK